MSDDLSGDTKLWRLLGNASTRQPSPYFTRKTVRAAQQASSPILLRRLLPLGALASVALALAATQWIAIENDRIALNETFRALADVEALVLPEEAPLWLGDSPL
jgi:hypothetical protein